MSFLTVPLSSGMNRSDFRSGSVALDDYFKRQANQDLKRRLAAVYVYLDHETIKGYYTLSNAGIPLTDVPEVIRKKMPTSYTQLPATLLGRLAIDDRFQRKGIGRLLLMDALHRSFNVSVSSIGSYAVVVDPIDVGAKGFYKQFGFIELTASQRLFLPMSTIKSLF